MERLAFNKILITVLICFSLTFSIAFLPTTVYAAPDCSESDSLIIDPEGEPARKADDLYCLIDRAKNIVLGTAGIIAVAMIIWGGIILATAAGNEERVAKGKKVLTFSIGGLLCIIFAQVLILAFVALLGGTT